MPHALFVVQVGYGEVEGERHQERNRCCVAGEVGWHHRGPWKEHGGHGSTGCGGRGPVVVTIDIEAVLVQGKGAQLGDSMGLLAQLPVQLLSV